MPTVVESNPAATVCAKIYAVVVDPGADLQTAFKLKAELRTDHDLTPNNIAGRLHRMAASVRRAADDLRISGNHAEAEAVMMRFKQLRGHRKP